MVAIWHVLQKGPFFFVFSVVLIEWVQAAHLQGQDDPDHQVWNKGYQSKYVVSLCEGDKKHTEGKASQIYRQT